ncbi:MAG: hypothetical protein M0036_19115 [Desulfobacteraceae bacterium]|nr:hypothetical protein [Desulfobacteraceae bacterium]
MVYSSLPDNERMQVLMTLEGQQCKLHGYFGECAVFAIPREDVLSIRQTIAALGLEIVKDSYFPLCSDNAPEHLRHDGPNTPYPGYRGNWRLFHLKPCGK